MNSCNKREDDNSSEGHQLQTDWELQMLGQKWGHGVILLLASLYVKKGTRQILFGVWELCVLADFFVNSEGCQYLTFFTPKKTYRVLRVGLWTILPILLNSIATAAAFAPFWGLFELDLSPWDSPKGLCNVGRVSGGGYWGLTIGQRYLTNSWPKSILTCIEI